MTHFFNIEEHEQNAFIWRYMDFSKYIELLENSSIFFPIVDKFEDKFEGIHNALGENDFYGVSNEGQTVKIKEAIDGNESQKQVTQVLSALVSNVRSGVGISCWRLSEHESHAMWKVFLKSNDGVAIKTTVRDLVDNIKPTSRYQNIYVGKVKYIDYRVNQVPVDNVFNALFHKNIYFEHEQELRFLVYSTKPGGIGNFQIGTLQPMPSPGISVKIKSKSLIHEVVVSPYASGTFFDLVKKITATRYKLFCPVNSSIIELNK